MVADNAIKHMSENLEKVSTLQGKLSTGKRYQVASEDPARASIGLSLRSNVKTIDSYTDAAEFTKNWMTATDNALDKMDELGIRATNLILRGLNDSLSGNERAHALGQEMQELVGQGTELGNTSLNGQYIFAGYQITSKPFNLTASATTLNDYQGVAFNPQVVTYNGDTTGTMQRNLGPDQSITLNVRGDQAIEKVLQQLVLATNALRQNDTVALGTILTDLRTELDTMGQHRTANGARMRQVESAASFLDTMKIETESLLSQNEDMNMAEGITLLANQQTTYDAVLQVSQRAISALSLFDYMK
jgi:flagellar hook-associated protein 3 FlgL